MPTDATGTPTALGIPKYNPNVDAPSGLGFNAAMDEIDAIITATQADVAEKIAAPAGPSAKEALVWNGSAWEKSSAANPINETHIDPGTNGQVLVTAGGAAAWGTPAFSGARVYHSIDQAVANNSVVTLSFDSESWDTDGYHDNATNNSRLTAPATGYYRVSLNVGWQANASGLRELRLVLSTGSIFALVEDAPVAGGFSVQSVSATVYMTSGQYVQAQAYQNSGGVLNAQRTSDYSTIFSIERIGS